MGLINLFKGEKKKEFCEMTQTEKKDFLANDLIERMVRIEQKLRASFGDGALPYTRTDYFKGLRPEEKKRFKQYIETKNKKRFWKIFSFIIFLSVGMMIGARITGNAIYSGQEIGTIDIVLVSLFILVCLLLIIHIALQKNRWKKLERHFNVVEKIIANRKNKK